MLVRGFVVVVRDACVDVDGLVIVQPRSAAEAAADAADAAAPPSTARRGAEYHPGGCGCCPLQHGAWPPHACAVARARVSHGEIAVARARVSHEVRR